MKPKKGMQPKKGMKPKKGTQPKKGIDMSYMHIQTPRQILTGPDFAGRGVKFITRRPDIGLMAELSEPLEAADQRQLKAFMATVDILMHATEQSLVARGVAP